MLTIPAISLKLRLVKADDIEVFSSECKVFNFESKKLFCVDLIVVVVLLILAILYRVFVQTLYGRNACVDINV